MPKEFDATLKTLFEFSPIDWPHLAGYPGEEATTLDADTSTISGATDKAVRVKGNPDWLMHVEFQSGPDRSLPGRMNLDSSILEDRHGLQVRSAAILLHPKANLRIVNGVHECRFPGDAEPYRVFRYRVIRIWELPVDHCLKGGLSLLPLAPLSHVTEAELPAVIERMKVRLSKVPHKADRQQLWTATYILMGLKYDSALGNQLLRGVMDMKESVTYQAILEEGEEKGEKKGRVKEVHKLLLRQGEVRFGTAPGAKAEKALSTLTDLDLLEALAVKLLSARSWEELLGLPARKSRRGS